MTEATNTGLNIIASEGTLVEVSDTGGANFLALPGVQSHAEGGGDLNSRQIKAFRGVSNALGLPDVSSITITALYSPNHPAWKRINAAARAGQLLTWRITTAKAAVHSAAAGGNDKAQVAANDMTITLSGDGSPNLLDGRFAEGMAIEIGTAAAPKSYTIESIPVKDNDGGKKAKIEGVFYNKDGSTGAVVDAAAAAPYNIRTPRLRLTYSAKAGKPPAALENEGNMTTSFTVYPQNLLPDWVVLAGDE